MSAIVPRTTGCASEAALAHTELAWGRSGISPMTGVSAGSTEGGAAVHPLAIDVASRGIRVNAVCPGINDTPLTRSFLDSAPDPGKLRAEYDAVSLLGRMGTADEVAACVRFLASDESSFVTGAPLLVDGGTLTMP